MKKLDDIERKNIFEVPENYFDDLALKIQSRTEVLTPSKGFWQNQFVFRYALPAVIIAATLIFIFKQKVSSSNVDELLASVPTEHLIAYLHESDMSEHELLEVIQLDLNDADSLNLKINENNPFGNINEIELKSVLENEL
ncbi:MAG TPA: hypothetical protein DGG95_13955 [Cytophagales bacterium]|jgi:hypothetical protein|nr:hypothetical protein [Cytophagales bacterium]